MKLNSKSLKTLALTLCVCAVARFSRAGDPTAFELIRQGNRYIGDQSKDKIVEIHSDRSSVTLFPTVWYIGYYDPDSTFKVAEVKFISGQEMNVNRPPRPFEQNTVIDHAKMKIDSDRALKIATDQPALNHLTLKASQLWLDHGDLGPVWKVRLWAAKVSKPDEQAEIGDTLISAEDGSIIKSDIHPDRVD